MPENDSMDRRNGAPRRAANDDIGEEKRKSSDRRQNDRRGFHLNLANADESFLDRMCEWLDENADGQWSAGPNENEPDESANTCRVRFEKQTDLAAFSMWVADWEKTSIG